MHALRVDEMSENRVPRVGVGGPVGSGKTMLIERVVPILAAKGYKIGIVSNDVVSRKMQIECVEISRSSNSYCHKSWL